jgi:hypothetical protein
VREAYLRAANSLNGMIAEGDEEKFVSQMELAAAHFGDTAGAMERTNRLLKKK